MEYSEATIENGQVAQKNVRIIDQSELSSECWLIQINGLSACKKCEFKGKKDCGGKDIIKKLKNEKGHKIPIGKPRMD